MKARIKIGARVGQDFGYGLWPSCKPVEGQIVDPSMIFDVEWCAVGKYWDCRADGFGAMPSNGIQGTYGNGSIFVFEKDGIEEILPSGETLSEIVEAATLAERKRIAEIFDKEAARQEKVWDKFLAEKNNKSATSFHTVFRDMADKIRCGKQ